MGFPRAYPYLRRLGVAVFSGDVPRIVKRALQAAIRSGQWGGTRITRVLIPIDLSACLNKTLKGGGPGGATTGSGDPVHSLPGLYLAAQHAVRARGGAGAAAGAAAGAGRHPHTVIAN